MIQTNFTDFRKKAADFFNEVEKGEVIRIIRRGKAIAEIQRIGTNKVPSWKKNLKPIEISGYSLSKGILEERRKSIR